MTRLGRRVAVLVAGLVALATLVGLTWWGSQAPGTLSVVGSILAGLFGVGLIVAGLRRRR